MIMLKKLFVNPIIYVTFKTAKFKYDYVDKTICTPCKSIE